MSRRARQQPAPSPPPPERQSPELDAGSERIPTAVETMAAFVEAFAPECFCARCLGDRIGVLYPLRDEVFAEAARQGLATRRAGTCNGCGTNASVLMAEDAARLSRTSGPSAQPPPPSWRGTPR